MRADRDYGEHEEVKLPLPNNVKEEQWVCADGTSLAVGEMTLSHCRNALRLVVRTTRARKVAAAARAERLLADSKAIAAANALVIESPLGPDGRPW